MSSNPIVPSSISRDPAKALVAAETNIQVGHLPLGASGLVMYRFEPEYVHQHPVGISLADLDRSHGGGRLLTLPERGSAITASRPARTGSTRRVVS